LHNGYNSLFIRLFSVACAGVQLLGSAHQTGYKTGYQLTQKDIRIMPITDTKARTATAKEKA
jgi:hypothetical protein